MSVIDYVLSKYPEDLAWQKYLILNGAKADRPNYLNKSTLQILLEKVGTPGMKQFTETYKEKISVNCEIEFKNRHLQDEKTDLTSKTTPCNYLVYIGAEVEFISYLIAMGADPNARDSYGWNVVSWACLTKQSRYLRSVDLSYSKIQGRNLNLNITVPIGWKETEGLTTPLCHVIFHANHDRELLKHVLAAT